MKKSIFLALLAVLILGSAVSLYAADVKWPSGPITIINPTKPGGFADIHARILVDYLQRKGISAAVVNMTDGGGTVGYEAVRKAKPDGLKLMYYHTTFAIACYTGVYKYDPDKDFTSVADLVNGGNNAYVVRADARWKNFNEFIEDGRKNPGKIIVGVQIGGTAHFMAAMIEKAAKVKFKMVDSGTEAEKLTALLGGFIDIANIGMQTTDQYVKAGKLRALMITGATRDAAFPQYPTAVEQGVDVVWNGDFYLYGPPGMSKELVQQINDVLKDFGTNDSISREALKKQGAFATGRNAEEAAKAMRETHAMLKALVAEVGL